MRLPYCSCVFLSSTNGIRFLALLLPHQERNLQLKPGRSDRYRKKSSDLLPVNFLKIRKRFLFRSLPSKACQENHFELADANIKEFAA